MINCLGSDCYFSSTPLSSTLRAFFEVIADALQAIVGLRSLAISCFDTLFVTVLDKCMFPHLRNLEFSSRPPSQSVGSFLLRHPNLQTLSFRWPYKGYVLDDFVSVSFSALTFFEGPGYIIPILLAKCPVKHVNILWDDEDTDYEAVLASLSSAPIHTLCNSSHRWNLPLVHAISRHCPEITSLKFKFDNEFGSNVDSGDELSDVSIQLNVTQLNRS